MRKRHIDRLFHTGILDSARHDLILNWLRVRPFSVYWELRVILYAGVLLLSSGLGILVYRNIDSIGHLAVIAGMSAVCLATFAWCFRYGQPYSHDKVKQKSVLFDYVLLLGCLLFLSLEGYVQYQYTLFGTRYGLASLIPALLFLFLSFRFDHIGVLTMALTALAAFAGFTFNASMFVSGDFSQTSLVVTGIGYGIFLFMCGTMLHRNGIKRHFRFPVFNYGLHVLGVTLVSALGLMDYPYIYLMLLFTGVVLLCMYARAVSSRYFLLMAVIYGYIGCTWLFFDLRILTSEKGNLLYFVLSGVGVVWLLLNLKRFMKERSDGL